MIDTLLLVLILAANIAGVVIARRGFRPRRPYKGATSVGLMPMPGFIAIRPEPEPDDHIIGMPLPLKGKVVAVGPGTPGFPDSRVSVGDEVWYQRHIIPVPVGDGSFFICKAEDIVVKEV